MATDAISVLGAGSGMDIKALTTSLVDAERVPRKDAIDKKITKPDQLKTFDREGYAFDAAHSSPSSWVFRRRLAD